MQKTVIIAAAVYLTVMIICWLVVDHSLAQWLYTHPLHALRNSMEIITRLGVGYVYWIGYILLLAYVLQPLYHKTCQRTPPPFLLHFSVSGLLALIYSGIGLRILKIIVGRARPYYWLEHPDVALLHFTNKTSFHSFPSGHSQTAFCVATILALAWQYHFQSKSIPYLLLGIAALVAISRVYLLSHYPSDIMAGAAIGTGCAYLAWHGNLTQRITQRLSSKINSVIVQSTKQERLP